jgi:protein gp37
MESGHGDKVSPGCAHCYAERMAMRLKAMGQKNYLQAVGRRVQEPDRS